MAQVLVQQRNENLPVKMEDSNGCHVINVFIVNIHSSQLSPKGVYYVSAYTLPTVVRHVLCYVRAIRTRVCCYVCAMRACVHCVVCHVCVCAMERVFAMYVNF